MTETLVRLGSIEPPLLLIMAFCTALVLFAMAFIAWQDCRRFEIHLELLALATLALVPVILVTDGLYGILDALITAALFGGSTWIACRLRPGRIGRGDIFLLAFLGFVAGRDEAVPVLAALGLFCILTAAGYSIARGKRLLRSMFPAALPGMGASVLALGLRFVGPADWDTSPLAPALTTARDVLIAVIMLATAFLVGMAFERRRHSAQGGDP